MVLTRDPFTDTMYNAWTKAVDLEQWAARAEARLKLPAVVRRLVWATTKGQRVFSFPAEEGVQRPGWDGRLTIENGNAWVPDGDSVWELSTGHEPATKANENYKKRSSATAPADASKLTFVFVAPCKWVDRQAWIDARRTERIWKDVRVLDSDDLEHWLETAPAVDVWVARMLGKAPVGVRDLSCHWDLLAAITTPPLPAAAFLAGRDKARDELRKALTGSAREVPVGALSEQEIIDFLAAAFGSLEENDALPARLVLVETRDAWDQLAACTEPFVLVPAPGLALDRIAVTRVVKTGHHVVTRRPYTTQVESGVIRLPRAWRHELTQTLTAAGFPEERAERLARESGGCLTALQRLASPGTGTATPAWAQDPDSTLLLPFILFGAFDDAKEADRDVVAQLTGSSYDNALAFASSWLIRPETPFRRTGTKWHFISREDTWLYLAPRLTRPLLDTLARIAVAVLAEEDPRFGLAPEQRPYALFQDKLPRHSPELREGLAESLALLGADLVPLPATPPGTGPGFARRIVRDLLPANPPAGLWFTLAPQLSLLAEAAPTEFLEAVERDVTSAQSAILSLFSGDAGGFFGGSLHHHLLWALSTLAWYPDYLARTALVLARLAILDPGGKTRPRPGDSLHDIFRLWYPQTGATAEQRSQVLDLLIEREPQQAWQLLIALLPKGRDSADPTHPPRWREWPSAKRPRVSRREFATQTHWIAERLLQLALRDPGKLHELTGHLEHLPEEEFTGLVGHLRTLDLAATPPVGRLALWNALRQLILRHEFFNTADWRMPKTRLLALHEAEEHLRPEAPAERGRWLFEQHHLTFGTYKETSYEKQTDMAYEQRQALLSEILKVGGVPAAVDFASTLDFPGLVGDVIGRATLVPDWTQILPAYLDHPNTRIVIFGRSYAGALFDQRGWGWVESLPLHNWTPAAVATLLFILPFMPRTWDLARSLGLDCESAYWAKVYPVPRGLNSEQAAYALQYLLKYNQPIVVADYVPMVYHNGLTLPVPLLAETLEKCVSLVGEEATAGHDVSTLVHHLGEVLRHLQEAHSAEPAQVARFEWIYLPVLKAGTATPKFLHQELDRDPAFFTQCVELVYRTATPDGPPPEKTQIDVMRAELAHQLLRSWPTQSGLLLGKGPDEPTLRAWITEARARCEGIGRLDPCDHEIGTLLASAPSEADGSWPCVVVRNILESIPRDVALDSFLTGVINHRGAVVRGFHEGGTKERELAKQYHEYADACQMRWPRVAATLRRLAEMNEADARDMDDRADEYN